MIGHTISHYRILEKIGEGGMGVIYKAEDLRLGRMVALKFLLPSKSFESAAKERFVREAKAASALDHPNICTIYEIDETPDGEIFIAMAHYPGQNLQELLTEGTPEPDEALEIIRQLAAGMAQAHRRGIVHQDINPRNIIMLKNGQVKLVDFGIAKLAGKSHVISKDSTMGTMSYMAPEQVQGKQVESATDVWALGTLFHELLTGRKVFDGDHLQAVMYSIVNVDAEPIKGLPPGLTAVLEKALEKNPRLRYKDAGEFLAALPSEHGGRKVDGAGSPIPGLGLFSTRRSRWAAAVILAAVIAFGIHQLGSFRRMDFNKRDLLLITEFENQTGEEVFDGTLRQALSYNLGQSPHVCLFAGRRLSHALERMELDPGAPVDARLGLELAQREGVVAVLEGAITRIDSTYRIGARLVNATTGETVDTKSARADKREEVFEAIDDLARNIRKDLGESLVSIRRRDKPLAKVTTSSLTALRHYTQGENFLVQADWKKAETFFREAVAVDSTFAIAYSKLGRVFFITARTNDALAFSAKAMNHRKKLNDRERYYIEAEYFRYRGDYDQAIDRFVLLLDDYPGDFDVRMNLITTYMLSHRYDAALSELNTAAELSPDNWYVHFALGNAFGGLARYDEAVREFRQVLSIRPRQARTMDNLSWILVCRGDPQGARALQDSMASGSSLPSVSLEYRQARFRYFLGENTVALDHLQKALGEVRRTDNTSQESWILIYRGLAQAGIGMEDGAREDFTAAIELWPGAIPRFHLGRTLVQLGDIRGAEEILTSLEAGDQAELTKTDRGLGHWLRGLIHLHGGRFKESAVETGMSIEILPDSEPRLTLARAYLAAGKFKQAREALRPVLEFPFISYLDGAGDVWPRALALAGLIAEEDGRKVEAIEFYEKALTIWAGADPNHQKMRETRLRLANMILDG